jgi:hypothetical protein
LDENVDSLVRNLGVEPKINENEGTPLVNEVDDFQENEAPPTNDHEEESQQENDDPQPIRRSQHEAMKSENSLKWQEAMEEELRSMKSNDVWDLVKFPDREKRVGCKWVYKMKYDSKGKI